MNTKLKYLVAMMAMSLPVMTIAAENETTSDTEVITVKGMKASLVTSAAIKRDSVEIVDSITAEDVGKLPDPNVAETLTRIPGVQGYRYGGEGASPVGSGSGLTIRGLSGQTASRLDGRAYFTAGGREFNIEGAIPGMISGIDVYKNPMAKHIEGGIGGLIDVHTRRPLDMDGEVISFAVGARYNDFAGEVKPEVFGLYSNKWQLSDGGEVGFLFAANFQETHNRSDSTPSNRGASLKRAVRADSAEYLTLSGANQAYAGQSDVWHLQSISEADAANYDSSELMTNISQNAHVFQEDIKRERVGYNAAFEWAPNDKLKTYIEGNYNKYKYNQDYRFMIMSDSSTVQNLVTKNYNLTEQLVNRNANGGSNDIISEQALVSGTFLDSSFFSLGGHESRPYTTWMIATGFEWDISDNLKNQTDLSYVKADQTRENFNVRLDPKAGLSWDVSRDLSGSPHDIAFSGPSLADADNFVLTSTGADALNVYDDNGYALQTDFQYYLDNDFFRTIHFGGRIASQESEFYDYRYGGINLTTDGNGLAADQSNAVEASDYADMLETAPNDWVRKEAGYTGGYLTFSPAAIASGKFRDELSQFGVPTSRTLMSNKHVEEDTLAAYVMTDFAVSSLDDRIRGNFGVRVVSADRTVSSGNTSIDTSETNVLPSLNITGEVQDDLLVRFAYAKGITRPNFSDLDASRTVLANETDGTASGTNPDLEALEADSFDISIEKYFGAATYLSAAIFYKDISGFINAVGNCETVEGVDPYSGAIANGCNNGQYFVTRAVNADDGNAQGIELAGQTFFDDLPGIWSNFGISASYTHVETDNPIRRDGKVVNTPQAFQSDDSYSFATMYEDEGLSARLVYTYRSDFVLFGVADYPINGRYVKGYGVLDASVNYEINDTYTISLSASNLTDEAPSRYVGEPGSGVTDFENQYYVNGRNFGITLRANFGG